MRSVCFAGKQRTFLVATCVAAFLVLAIDAERAHAIPAFARKYQTSCTTCHSGFPKLNGTGLAFRFNGYRFAREDEDKVKDPPLQLGNESYRDMFPNSILPSTIPGMPPLSVEVQQTMITNIANPKGIPGPGNSPNFDFPTTINLMSAGTLSNKISYWVNGGLASNGAGGYDPFVERAFLVVNNLFAADSDEDENGLHLAPSLLLPRHLLNIRFGQFEPQAIAPYASTYRALSIQNRLTSTLMSGSSSFAFEPALRGIEAYGAWRNNTSWCVGLVDGSAQGGPNVANSGGNSRKDFYGRIGHKWWGYPIDGEVVAVKKYKPKIPEAPKSDDEPKEESASGNEVTRAQNADDAEEDDPTPWIDYYRQTQFETGIFGYSGRNGVSPLNNPYLFTSGTTTAINNDNFSRVGGDFQWQHHDLHIIGTYMYGQDTNPGTGFSVQFNSWFLEANYYFKPWIIGYARYEELQFLQRPGITANNIQRAVPGVAFYPIVNMAVRTEFNIDTSGKGTSPNQFLIMADYAF